jgi:hypothetical protein
MFSFLDAKGFLFVGPIVWIFSKHQYGVITSMQHSLMLSKDNDETLPNFIKRKHPRKGEKKKQRASTKVQASKEPKQGGATRRKWNH